MTRPISPHEDAWPFIAMHLASALREAQLILTEPDLFDLIKKRYREGEAIHRREWMTWDSERFDAEAREEAADLLCYLAMRRAK